MPGTKSELISLEVRKQLLLAESEVNRANLLNDLACLRNETRAIACHMESVSRSVASVTSMGIAGFNALREMRKKRSNGKTSWFSKLMGATRLGASLWTAFRSGYR